MLSLSDAIFTIIVAVVVLIIVIILTVRAEAHSEELMDQPHWADPMPLALPV